MGQGVFPCKVSGYDAKGNELLEVVNDSQVINFLQSRTVRRYLANAYRDILKFGISFPQLIPNIAGNQIGRISLIPKISKFIQSSITTIPWPTSSVSATPEKLPEEVTSIRSATSGTAATFILCLPGGLPN